MIQPRIVLDVSNSTHSCSLQFLYCLLVAEDEVSKEVVNEVGNGAGGSGGNMVVVGCKGFGLWAAQSAGES